MIDLFASLTPPAVQEEPPQEQLIQEANEILDKQEREETTTYTDERSGEVYTVLNILGWDEMPEKLTAEQADRVLEVVGAKLDAIKRIEKNAEECKKPHQSFHDWVLMQVKHLLHKYGHENVERYSRGKNKGEPKNKYVQLPHGRILLGISGGVDCFDGKAYQAWLKKQNPKDLVKWGATVTFECKRGDLSDFDFQMLERVGKVEIHLGKEKVIELMDGVKSDDGKTWVEHPKAVEGWKKTPIDPVGAFRGIA